MALLEAKNITKRFGGLVAVNDLDVTVEEGEIVAMIGPNGAGKTTAFNVISGLYKPSAGKVIFKNKDITSWRPDLICKEGLTRTFQDNKPFPKLSVRDNVIVGAYNHIADTKKAMIKVDETLEFMGMISQADQLVGSLTIASRKRLELARALSTDPTLLLLDEVMAGLRPTETDEMIDLVRKVCDQGISILLVEHVMKVVMSLASRVVVIHHGTKIAEGSPNEVVKDRLVIEAYLGEAQADVAS